MELYIPSYFNKILITTYNFIGDIMGSCEFVTFISIFACTIAKDKTDEELAILAAFFTQLRRYFSNPFSVFK